MKPTLYLYEHQYVDSSRTSMEALANTPGARCAYHPVDLKINGAERNPQVY
ncbi:MAG TPA: hypothetical protein V6D12_10690 [Candidatus Obscuribacterales bacterium]